MVSLQFRTTKFSLGYALTLAQIDWGRDILQLHPAKRVLS